MKKIFALLLAVVMVLCAFVSCGKTPAETTEEAVTTVPETTEEDPPVFEIAGVTEFADYALIYSANNTGWLEKQVIGDFTRAMRTLTDEIVPAKPDTTTDTYTHLIVLGAAANNIVDVSDLDNDTFRVELKDGNVYVGGKTPEARMGALITLTDMIYDKTPISENFEGSYSEMSDYIPGDKYRLTWSDDFEGSSIDQKKWDDRYQSTKDILITPNSLTRRVENGVLYLTATNCPEAAIVGEKKYIASPFPCTEGTMSFKYGYAEVRAKLNFSFGSSAAIWSVGDKQLGDVSHGVMEIDLVELLGRNNSVISTVHRWHYPVDSTHPNDHTQTKVAAADRTYFFNKTPEELSNEYHVYGLEWTPDYMKFYVDGNPYWTVDITEEGATDGYSNLCFHEPLCLILSQFLYTPARGFSYSLKGNEKFSYTSEFDYVKIFQTDLGELNEYDDFN